jgi:putative transposase
LAPTLGKAPPCPDGTSSGPHPDGKVRRFHARTLVDHYCYLILDGITLKVKGVLGVEKRLVLWAYGTTPEGRQEMVSFCQATDESEAQWEVFLQDLYQRGLEGKFLALVVSNGNRGLCRALDLVCRYAPPQRCWVHKLRNVAAKLPKRTQKVCLDGTKAIYQASTRREAVMRFRNWASEWRSRQPKAVACLKSHWRRIRATNAIEQAFREVRRRTRPMRCF